MMVITLLLFEIARSTEKFSKVTELLHEEKKKTGNVQRTLIFVQRKKQTDMLAIYLSEKSIPSLSINGDREQAQREAALRDFRRGTTRVLVATDVCARGIDVADLQHVSFCVHFFKIKSLLVD